MTGGGNIAIGSQSGFNLSSGSQNIYIGNYGVSGAYGAYGSESGVIRIGSSGLQSSAFMAGVTSTNLTADTNAVPVVIDSVTGQLGVGAVTAGPTGPVGPVGPPGVQGAPGVAGTPGAIGPQGVAGPTGATGPQGAAGPSGATGATGPSGYKGRWDPSITYQPGDIVSYSFIIDQNYIATAAAQTVTSTDYSVSIPVSCMYIAAETATPNVGQQPNLTAFPLGSELVGQPNGDLGTFGSYWFAINDMKIQINIGRISQPNYTVNPILDRCVKIANSDYNSQTPNGYFVGGMYYILP